MSMSDGECEERERAERERERRSIFARGSRIRYSPPPPNAGQGQEDFHSRPKEKRTLPSPETAEKQPQRSRHQDAGDEGRLLGRGSTDPFSKLECRGKEELQDLAKVAVDNIMKAAGMGLPTAQSRLHKSELASVALHGQHLLAIVASLNIRLAESEIRAHKAELGTAEAKIRALQAETKAGPTEIECSTVRPVSYSDCLKLGKNQERPKPSSGPLVAVYPAEGTSDGTQTAEATKMALKKAVNPASCGIQIRGIRKVGNAGIVVQTTSQEAADRLRKAIPTTLRAADPLQRKPLVALNNVDGDPKTDELLGNLHEQNFGDSKEWNFEKLKKETRVAFKRSRVGGRRTTIVLECSPALRDELINKGRIFLGWDVITVSDYVRVTCCTKCQQYGHPEKLCRAVERTCGRCGINGHSTVDCKSEITACATCKKFGNPSDHRTASMECPARRHAEGRYISSVNYG